MKLAIHGGAPLVPEQYRHFEHPTITERQEQAVLRQLHENISIYDNGGIYAKLEGALRERFGVEHVLTVNSGTTALFSMFFALDLQPGDEVIVPAYTFFATATPLFMLGTIPVLADCRTNGNLDPEAVRAKVTSRTKAIVMTHMWGIPCDLDELISVARAANVPLLEDGSHAFGATYHGRPVGSTTDAAAISMQGKKILTAGEGGLYLTNHQVMFERAVLAGHFNKRAKKEVFSVPLKEFVVTGLGLNFRTHPLGAALAYDWLSDVDRMLREKREVAAMLKRELGTIPGLSFPEVPENSEPAWYTFPFFYDPTAFNGVDKETFADAVIAEGARDLDVPHSTCPLTHYPIFHDPSPALSHYRQHRERFRVNDGPFPGADGFHARVINLPVWYGPERLLYAQHYIDAIRKVASQSSSLISP